MRFCEVGNDVKYGYTLDEFYEMLDLMGVVDDDFVLFEYLIDKGEIDETGEVIGDRYGLAKITDKTDKGLCHIVEETYIFIPAVGIRRFIKDVSKRTIT